MKDNLLRLKTRVLDLSTPLVMGVVNLTDNSFYNDSRIGRLDYLIERVETMVADGVDIVDLGAASSRPGAVTPSADEEIDRLIPALIACRANFPELVISIDTFQTRVLKECDKVGIDIVNDISAGSMDPDFLSEVARTSLPYILMHMKGHPNNMQENTLYDNLIWDIVQFMTAKLSECRALGITDIIIDPGFGFGKSLDDNYKLLGALRSFSFLGCPLLAGISRKSMIYNILKCTPNEALNGTTALNMIALMNGAKILRVHDVKEARECVDLYLQYDQNIN